jgi:hypothetical protein
MIAPRVYSSGAEKGGERMHAHLHGAVTIDRRRFVQGAAATAAAAGVAGPLAWPEGAEAGGRGDRVDPVPAPKPIPGGIDVPPLIHVFVPGPEGQVLEFTQTVLQGFDVEPSTITDFDGFTALAYLLGTATGSDGQQYNLEVDIRSFEGEYVGEDGSRNFGTFGFI